MNIYYLPGSLGFSVGTTGAMPTLAWHVVTADG